MHVLSVSMQSFRGAADRFTVDLAAPGEGPEGGTPAPVIVYGANGSGKSSICDALEFGLRGVVSRRTVGGEKERREIKNVFSSTPPQVDVTLSDGRTVRRGAARSRGENAAGPLDGSAHCPVVVRRSAVEGFWQATEDSRLEFFWDYVRQPAEGWQTSADVRAVKQHRALRARLDRLERVIRADLIPDTFRYEKTGATFIFPTHLGPAGVVRRVALGHRKATSGRRARLSAAEERVIAEYVEVLGAEEGLRSAAGEARARRPRRDEELEVMLAAAAPRVADDFIAISGQDWLTGVRLVVTPGGGLHVELRAGEKRFDPVGVLSEAYLDLLALLIVVEMHIECVARGQYPILVLDDVFQSVDAPLRTRTLRHLSRRLDGWQLVMTVHDRLWLELARRTLREEGLGEARTLEVRRSGGRDSTPRVFGVGTGPLRDLDFVEQNGGSATLLAAAGGRALEALLDQLSISLKCTMVRQNPEKYMIQQLIDATKPKLSTCALDGVRTGIELVSRTQFMRNAVGAHYSAEADGVADDEVRDVCAHVREMWRLLSCGRCGSVVQKGSAAAGGAWLPRPTCHCAV